MCLLHLSVLSSRASRLIGLFFIFFFIFGNTGPYGRKHFKTLFPYKPQPIIFKFLLNFLPSSPHKKIFFFEILKNEILTISFSLLLTWAQIGATFQKATPSTNCSHTFSDLSWIFVPMALRKLHWEFFEILNFRFFSFFKFTIVPYGGTKISFSWKTSDRKCETGWHLGLWCSILTYMDYLLLTPT